MTLVLVSTVTVGAGGAASIEFTGIPQSATDLVILLSARLASNAGNSNMVLRLNGQTSGYTYKLLEGSGSSAASFGYASQDAYWFGTIQGTSTTASTFGNGQIYVPNYTSTINKSISTDLVTENNATAAYQDLGACLMTSSSAVTSITFIAGGLNFAQYSTASLYTITKGSGGASVA